ncbi:MAG: hypothetical protein GWO28_01245 [candidate division Zixibacteria bacterium]|nr:hypothetical protein [candidate division Zixibacteria bacterium]
MRVLVIGPANYTYILRNILKEGEMEFIQADDILPPGLDWSSIDIMLLTGGPDVSPHLYGESPTAGTNSVIARDVREQTLYDVALRHNVAMIGICRGAQFLNVMNGGKLHQHVRNHRANHPINLLTRFGEFPETIQVNSSHHQMMVVPKDGQILAYASNIAFQGGVVEPEVVFFPATRSLCIQYHPERMMQDSLGLKYTQSLIEALIIPR